MWKKKGQLCAFNVVLVRLVHDLVICLVVSINNWLDLRSRLAYGCPLTDWASVSLQIKKPHGLKAV